MSSDPHSTYKSTQIETASQEQILLMLYEGLLKFTRQAREALEEENYEKAHNKLLRSQDIVTELMSTLDMDIGGEIAEELYRLYDFVLHNLIQANVEKDPSRVDDVIPVLEELNEAWNEVINEKGMTVEKAREQLGMSASSGDSDDQSESNEAPKEQTQSGSVGGSSKLDGNVTYGDIG